MLSLPQIPSFAARLYLSLLPAGLPCYIQYLEDRFELVTQPMLAQSEGAVEYTDCLSAEG